MGQDVTVFGGTGFLGGRVVRHLRDKGFSVRVASRHPRTLSGDDPEVKPVAADIRERPSIAAAVEDAFGVVNAVSLYVEHGAETFQAVHVAAAERVAVEVVRSRSRAVHSGLGNRRRCGVTLPLHPRARAGRAGDPRGIRWRRRDPTRGDVRTG